MKPPKMPAKAGRSTAEKSQGRIKGSGVNKPMPVNAVPQTKAKVTYGNPGQKRPMG